MDIAKTYSNLSQCEPCKKVIRKVMVDEREKVEQSSEIYLRYKKPSNCKCHGFE